MSSIIRYLLLLLLILNIQLSGSLLKAQPPFTSKTFTTADGLVNNSVTSICQDKTGFLWIGTLYGVSRFDGFEFKNYLYNVTDSVSLPSFVIDKLIADGRNNLFAFSNNQPVSFYNRGNDRFEKIVIRGTRKDMEFSDIQTDGDDRIWIAGDYKIFRSSDGGKHFISIAATDSSGRPFTLNSRPRISIDNIGTVWIYTAEKGKLFFHQFNYRNDTSLFVRNKEPFTTEYSYRNDYFRNGMIRIYRSESGKTWLFSDNGRYLLKQNRFMLVTDSVGCSDYRGDGPFIWIDPVSGVNYYDPVRKARKCSGIQNGESLSSACFSTQGIIWSSGTESGNSGIGLKCYTEVPGYFHHYLTEMNEKGEPNLVFPILKDRYGDIWAGTRRSDFIYHLKADGRVIKEKYLDKFYGINFPKVRSMTEDENGIWLGCTEDHLIFYDFRSGSFKTRHKSPFIYRFRQTPLHIHNILDNGDEILINGWLGIYSFNKISGYIRLIFPFPIKGRSFTIEKEKNGDLWAGSHNATIIRVDKSLKYHNELSLGNSNALATDITAGDHNDLWVALQGSGLGHYFKNLNLYEIFSEADGLLNKNVYSVLMDKTGKVWLSTENGISCFNPLTRRFRNFSANDGLLIKDFNDDSNFIDKEGNMFFGGVGGFVSFNPEEINMENSIGYPLLVTSISVSGKVLKRKKPVYELDTITLGKGDNNFLASISCLDFREGNYLKYRYRLKGISDKWAESDQKNRNIIYFNLKPGRYRLEVEAIGVNGSWISERAVTIIIPPGVYQTLWFKFLSGILVFLLIASLVILYIRHISLIAKQESDELRLEALRARMNPHFIFNSLNSINYYILNNDKLSANRYITDFARLMRAFLNNLSGEFILLGSEVQMIRDYLDLEKMRFRDRFAFSVTVFEDLDPDRHYVFPGIVQPFVENAVIHGVSALEEREGNISVLFANEGDSVIKCIIEDNGIGRKCSEKYRHHDNDRNARGTDIVRERLKLYNRHKNTSYRFEIDDLYNKTEAIGTRVIIYIPAKSF
jgi:ligand-binding sensor domain-containing protein